MSYDPNDPAMRYQQQDNHALSIPLYLILSLLTCFLFDLYWNYRQMEACNELLGRDEFHFWQWLLLVVITFGLYHFYYQYQMGSAIVEIQDRKGLPITEGLPVLSVIATLFGFGLVADCIHQLEINRIVD
ncbi:MAG: hypothetical protein ACI8W3_001797 [Myxococcota bacterium]|jgi:hypothetical protein